MAEETKNVVQETAAASTAEQDVYVPVKPSERMKAREVFMVFVGLWVAMFSVNIGMQVGQSLSVGLAILATLLVQVATIRTKPANTPRPTLLIKMSLRSAVPYAHAKYAPIRRMIQKEIKKPMKEPTTASLSRLE